MAGSTTGPVAAWAGTVSGAVMSNREQAAVTQATRLPRGVRCTISLSIELRARNASLEREGVRARRTHRDDGARLAHRDLNFLSAWQWAAQECNGFIESEQILQD